MHFDLMAPVAAEQGGGAQGRGSADVDGLQQHVVEAQIRANDLQVQLTRLREQQARGNDIDRLQLEKPYAALQHEYAVNSADLDMAQLRLNRLMAQTTMAPPRAELIDRSMIEETATGVFILMIPIAIALARRIWVRSGPRVQPQVVNLDSSPRLQRIEEAVESIAIEVERIGEAQRFATKLLTERPEPVANRPLAAATPIVRKTPGTITPH